MASSFDLIKSVLRKIETGDPVVVENVLLSSSTKELAMVCSLMQPEEREKLLSRLSRVKRTDVIDTVNYFKRVRITQTQYNKVIKTMIDHLDNGIQGSAGTSFFRPKKRV